MEIVLTPDEMRAADEATIASGISAYELMDRAAYGCAMTALRTLGGSYGKRVVIVCGKGNNGGDGIACAKHLARHGVHCVVLLLDDPKGDPARHLDDLHGVRIERWSREAFERQAPDLVVDAVFGTGCSGAPRGDAAEAIECMGSHRVLAIDIPSGVNGADGSVPGVAVQALVTVAIQTLKVGHVTTPGAMRCGRIDVCDIGIPVHGGRTFVPEEQDVFANLPKLEADTHKYEVGALAVIAGSAGMTGAAILVARGAIRGGAGLVMLGIPASSLEVFEEAVLEAIKVPLPDVEGQLEAKAVDEFSDRLERCKALAIGPGLGRGPRAVAVVKRAIDVELPIVCDGDGLWALAEILKDEPDAIRERKGSTIVTPHSGEFAFLAGHTPGSDRVDEARSLAERLGAVVHLKGRRAVTASPAGDAWVNPTGNPGAATGGTGDVLTGIVASLVAQGAEPITATCAGAYLHGLAADLVAARKGEHSLVASDLPEALPQAIRGLRRERPPRRALRTVIA